MAAIAKQYFMGTGAQVHSCVSLWFSASFSVKIHLTMVWLWSCLVSIASTARHYPSALLHQGPSQVSIVVSIDQDQS